MCRWREMKSQDIGALASVAVIKHVRIKRLSWEFCLFDAPQTLSLQARISRQRRSMRERQMHVTGALAEGEEQIVLLARAITANGHALRRRDAQGQPRWSALRRDREIQKQEDSCHWPYARERTWYGCYGLT